ncbi:hypothetical protein M0R45_005043 [Rubus argutus]|uniref:Uncharacterized protein n=1 Tax=Rubus argutus TaxID=59490 RepID=A0AAW1YM39_RUBAR
MSRPFQSLKQHRRVQPALPATASPVLSSGVATPSPNSSARSISDAAKNSSPAMHLPATDVGILSPPIKTTDWNRNQKKKEMEMREKSSPLPLQFASPATPFHRRRRSSSPLDLHRTRVR